MKSTGVETIKWVNADSLIPSPKNPNKHPQQQIDDLAKILKYQGFRSPIIVSNQTGHIVVGHGRLMAAKQLGMVMVPVSHQDFDDWDQEYAHMCADNGIAERATMDLSMVNAEIPNLGPIDIDLLGIANFKVEAADKGPAGNEDVNFQPRLEIVFKTESDQQMIYSELLERGYEVRVLS